MFEIMSLRRSGEQPEPSTSSLFFPRYLLPSLRIPFRRRTSDPSSPTSPASTVPSLSTSPASPTSSVTPNLPTPGRRLSRAHPTTLRCRACSTDLALHSQIISKCFHGRHGRAYLLAPPPSSDPLPTPRRGSLPPLSHNKDNNNENSPETELVNIRVGRSEDRNLVTGPHVVADISCVGCGVVVGWKYIDARDPGQQYKVGKFILETRRVVGFHSWEDIDVPVMTDALDRAGEGKGREEEAEGVVVFDSDDEDECDDIFAGVWDARVVEKRRQSKVENHEDGW